jgi:hypothetical protein
MEAEITNFAEDSTNKCQLDFFSECYSLGLSPSIFEMAKKLLRSSWFIITPHLYGNLVLKVQFKKLFLQFSCILPSGLFIRKVFPFDQAFGKTFPPCFDPASIYDCFRFYDDGTIIVERWQSRTTCIGITNLLFQQRNMEYRMDAKTCKKLELIYYLADAFFNWKGPIKPMS